MSAIIRLSTPADVPAMNRVRIASWRKAYAGIFPQDVLDNLSETAGIDRWRAEIESGQRTDLLYESDTGEILGFLTAGMSRDDDADPIRTGEIWAFYVHPDHWSKGVGRALWDYARTTEFAGYRDVTVWTLLDNRIGRAAYVRLGFRLDLPHEGGMITRNWEGVPLKQVRYRYPGGPPAASSDPAWFGH